MASVISEMDQILAKAMSEKIKFKKEEGNRFCYIANIPQKYRQAIVNNYQYIEIWDHDKMLTLEDNHGIIRGNVNGVEKNGVYSLWERQTAKDIYLSTCDGSDLLNNGRYLLLICYANGNEFFIPLSPTAQDNPVKAYQFIQNARQKQKLDAVRLEAKEAQERAINAALKQASENARQEKDQAVAQARTDATAAANAAHVQALNAARREVEVERAEKEAAKSETESARNRAQAAKLEAEAAKHEAETAKHKLNLIEIQAKELQEKEQKNLKEAKEKPLSNSSASSLLFSNAAPGGSIYNQSGMTPTSTAMGETVLGHSVNLNHYPTDGGIDKKNSTSKKAGISGGYIIVNHQ